MRNFTTALFTLLVLYSHGEGWIKKANYEGAARHRTTAFAIGNKGYLGLGHVNSGPQGNILFEDFWAYDPSSNSWTQIADYGGGLMYHSACFVVANIAYVTTGRDEFSNYVNETWAYDPLTNTWTAKAPFPGSVRRGAVGFAIGDWGYVGTGQTYSGVSADFYAYNAAQDTWYAIPSLPGPARTSAVGFELNGRGYVGTGGASTWGNSVNDFWEFDPNTTQWTQKADVGPTTRMEACGFAVHGKGFIGTGDNFSSGTNYGDMWEYDQATDTWIQIEDFAGLKRRYLSAFVIGDRAFAGTGTNGTNFKDFYEFDYLLSVLTRDETQVEVSAYPNPVVNQLNVKVNLPDEVGSENVNLALYNLFGQKVLSSNVDESIIIDVEGLSIGMYILRVEYGDNVIASERIIKQ